MKTELVVALVAGAVAIVSAGMSYSVQQKIAASQGRMDILRSELQRQHERQQPFLEQQMELYFEAADTAAKIATSRDESHREKLLQRFWELYWGPLAVVEDQPVVDAMVAFGDALNDDPSNAAALKRIVLETRSCVSRFLAEIVGYRSGTTNDAAPRSAPGQMTATR